MAKKYRIDIALEVQKAIANARAFNAELSKIDRAAQQAAARAQQTVNRAGGGGTGAGGRGGAAAAMRQQIADARAAGAVLLSDKQKHIAQQQGLEDRYLLREYGGRVRHQARLQAAAERAAQKTQRDQARAAQQAQKQADQDAARKAAVEDRYLKRDYAARVAAERRKQQQAERTAQRSQAQAERDAQRLQQIQDRYLQREQSRRNAWERRKQTAAERAAKADIRREERKQEQLKAIEDRWLRREYRDRVAHQRRKDEEAAADTAQHNQRSEMMIAGYGATAAYAAGRALQFFFEQVDKVREHLLESAEAVQQMRRDIRLEAGLMGEGRTTNKALQANLAFRMSTGLDQSGASDFVRQFEGSLPVGIEKGNISRQTADELKIAAGIRANRLGGDMNTHGDLAGILGQYGKIGSSQEGLSQLEAIRYALTAGRGDDPILTRQLLKAAGSTVREGGAVGTLPEMAALIGVTSLTAGPEEAGTRAEQLVRGLRTGLTKHRKGKGMKSSQSEYLKKLGIDEKDNLEAMLDKIVPDIEKAKAAGRDADVYLSERGFRSFEERRALIEVAENYQPLKQRFAETRKQASTFGPGQEQLNKEYMDSTEGRTGVAEAADAAGKVAEGLKAERWKALLKEAEASPEFKAEERSTMTGLGDFGMGLIQGHVSDAVTTGRRSRLEGHAYDILKKKAKKAGITDDELYKAWGDATRTAGQSPEGFTDIGRDQEYTNLVESMIKQKVGVGGNQADTAGAMRDLKGSIDNLAKKFDQQGGAGPNQAPPALPPAPRGGPVNP